MSLRVVITGMGAVTPLGNTVDSFWEGLIHGRSGIDKITAFDPSRLTSQIAGEVKDFNPAPHFSHPKKGLRADRSSQFAVAAASQAFIHSGLKNLHTFNPNRGGVVFGASNGGITTLSKQFQILVEKGPSKLSPFLIPMLRTNMAAAMVAIELGLEGPNFSVGAACASASEAIGQAWRLIRNGEADFILTGGSEAPICELMVGGFCAMKALSQRNSSPQQASRPFDLERDGFVISEGAGALVLEEESHARRRGATILAEIIGHGLTTDAYHITQPSADGKGVAASMNAALAQAKCQPSELSYVIAHATSTKAGDRAEARAIQSLFGHHSTPVTALKSMTGHLCGASSAIELIGAVKSIEQSLIPPTINLFRPDKHFALNHVANQPREAKIKNVVINAFGFGGNNSSLVISRY
ncbi:MAG: beta-ketoacyl-ACP synthase II [Verrucomicrobia bacterium]|nr:beta-ketoacyl-ACP synthase II [Verrucomicrobiota bacterium]